MVEAKPRQPAWHAAFVIVVGVSKTLGEMAFLALHHRE
jgi:hypothetical protein